MDITLLVIYLPLLAIGMYCAYKRGIFVGQCQRDHIHCPATWLTPRHIQEELIKQAKRNRLYLRDHIDEECLRIIEARFQTHLPAFQRKPDASFDPLTAAHRDGAREVTLYLRQQIELADLESKND